MCEKRVSTTQHAANNMQNTAQLPQQLSAHFFTCHAHYFLLLRLSYAWEN